MPVHPATTLRERLIAALEADLVGPFDGNPASTEQLPLPPSRWYWAGFLAPDQRREPSEADADSELASGSDLTEEEGGTGVEPQPKQKKTFAASLGISVLLPARARADRISVVASFATYAQRERPREDGKGMRVAWCRLPHGPIAVELALEPESLRKGRQLPDWPGVFIQGELRAAPDGMRVLSVFLVNRRAGADVGKADEDFLFQVRLELTYAEGFEARPNRLGEDASEADDRVADLQYRSHREWAVGHGVAVEAMAVDPKTERVHRVRTTFVPVSEVLGVKTNDRGVTTNMLELASLTDGKELKATLSPLLSTYADWIVQQKAIAVDGDRRKETQRHLMEQAEQARGRIARGIQRLANDSEARQAFNWANDVMAQAALRRTPDDYTQGKTPAWRMFQLAFLLLNLEDIVDERSPDRDHVELIFFPTGGGKTEAYLGVIAFVLLLRRLRGQNRPDKGLGVAVLLRYTLRLLTLDQLGRAATLMCQLELLRQRVPDRLGAERFAVGLWVGRSATANTLAEVHKAILDYRGSTSENATSPFPLAACPHCREAFGRDALQLWPNAHNPERVVVGCSNFRCEFSARKNSDGLPVLFVDEQIYRELPAFLVATVDKFAMLPWRGETGLLFGRAQARRGPSFFGPMDGGLPKGAEELPDGLLPPELIVQDELHLISGPLGTMVGLYESAIEFLCTRTLPGGAGLKPKVIASTATLRRAQTQIKTLFGRDMRLFPPQGVDAFDSFFASVDDTKPGRLYAGVAAHGRSMKGTLIRVYATLLTAAHRNYDKKGPADQTADAYMTLVGYFNSLRELGGMRRLVEDDVHSRALSIEDRKPLAFAGAHPFQSKRELQREPVELTSRESTNNIKRAKDRLQIAYAQAKHVDVLLASNMISVGVDIDRLGLMVVAGQPKTTSEYIQASSRVGRKTPGLVVTCYNLARPRDRSHFERFASYHEAFYRFVEAVSLTPFSGPALDRGLAGTLLAMTRLGAPVMTPSNAVMSIEQERGHAEAAAEVLAARGGDQGEKTHDELLRRAKKLLDSWQRVVNAARDEDAALRSYSRFDRDGAPGKPLLFLATDPDKPNPDTHEGKFQAPTSMRDVEQTVQLWLRESLGGNG
jgi:hypothetical protein